MFASPTVTRAIRAWRPSEGPVAIVDIGTTKICVLSAQLGPLGAPQLVACRTVAAHGLREGLVVDQAAVAESIDQAVNELGGDERLPFRFVVINVTGSHLIGQVLTGGLTVAEKGAQITPLHLSKLLERTKATHVPLERELLHTILQGYRIDGQTGIREAVGMFGSKIEAELLVVTGLYGAVQNLIQAVEQTGLSVDGIVSSPIALAYGAVSEEERDEGALVIDVGGGTTETALLVDGVPRWIDVQPTAGEAFTHAVAAELKISIDDAERVKCADGTVKVSEAEDRPLRTPLSPSGPGEWTRRRLGAILAHQVDALFLAIRERLRESGELSRPVTTLVICGGSSVLEGMVERAEEVFGIPARLGRPQKIRSRFVEETSPAHVTSFGLLRYAVARRQARRLGEDVDHSVFHRVLSRANLLLREYF